MKFLIYDWATKNDEIHGFALSDSNKCLLRITGFKNYFYVLLDETTDIDTAKAEIEHHGGVSVSSIEKTLYGYNQTTNALLVLTDNNNTYKSLTFLLSRKGYTLAESDISSARKLTALKDIPYYPEIEVNQEDLIAPAERLSKDNVLEFMLPWQSIRKTEGVIINPLLLSFDIETYKPSTRRGMPDPDEADNCIFFISMIFQRLNTTIRERYSVVLGQIDENTLPFGTTVIEARTEKILLQKFFELIQEKTPDIIIAYNSHSWDWKYINVRMNLHKLKWQHDLGTYKKDKVSVKDIIWDSSSFGSNIIIYPKINGIIIFDVFRYFKITRPTLQRHSLEFVSQMFLGRGKFPVSQDMMVRAFESKSIGAMSEVARYNLEDSELVLDLVKSQLIITVAKMQSLVFDTSIEDLYLRGMQVRSYNSLYVYAKNKDLIFNRISMSAPRMRGAFVMEPITGFHRNVIKLDINSLYPSILIHYNICYSTYITPEQIERNGEYCHTMQYVTDDGERLDTHFVDKSVAEGVTVSMVKDLINKRRAIKEQLKTIKDDATWIAFNEHQKTLKLLANSMIGLMEADDKFSKLPFPQGAGVIKTKGRELIQEIMEYVSTTWGKVIYGDTDSIFVKVDASRGIVKLGQKIAREINKKFAPFTIEFEGAGLCLLVTKKKYSFWPTDNDGNLLDESTVVHAGTELVRRDACKFVCSSLRSVTNAIFEDATKNDVLAIILANVINLLEGTIPIEHLSMSKKVGKDYKQLNSFINVFATKERESGKTIHAGDTVEYVIVKGPKKTTIGQRMVTPEYFIETKKTSDKSIDIDETYILDRLHSCIDNLYSAVYTDPEEVALSNKGVQTETSLCSSNQPVKDIISLLKKGKLDLDKLKEINKQNKERIKQRSKAGEPVPKEVLRLVITSSTHDTE